MFVFKVEKSCKAAKLYAAVFQYFNAQVPYGNKFNISCRIIKSSFIYGLISGIFGNDQGLKIEIERTAG